MEIHTEGVKYAGSKRKLLPHILAMVSELPCRSVWDGFSGTTRVSQALAQSGFQVISSDISELSEVFATAYLQNRQSPEKYQELIDHLNGLSSVDGWFSEHYGGDVLPDGSSVQPDGRKRPFQRKNMRKTDAIREELERLNLDSITHAVGLVSLILALDAVDNTLGHFASYLRVWSPRSYRDLTLRVPKLWVNERENDVFRADIFDLLGKVRADVAYLDPPYGSANEKMPPSRIRYTSYYHFWKTLIINDRPAIFGKALRRNDSADLLSASVFEEFRKDSTGKFLAVEAIHRMLREIQVPWVLLSYSSRGRATTRDLMEVIQDVGRLEKIETIGHPRHVMSHMQWTREWIQHLEEPNREYLFLIRRSRFS
ncbi:MAG: DNA adenine methylase [Planctomycetia bacterium]|nr:DNA adenine methylase [Planctomycetia bacterium]